MPKSKPAAKTLTDDEVIDRAKKWARLHRNEKSRARMDEALEGISTADQRRVYLCGQRIVGGLPIKVIPSTQQPERSNHANRSNTKDRKAR